MKEKHKNLMVWIALALFAAFACMSIVRAQTPSTEAVISKSDGLHAGNIAADRIAFRDASPTAKPIITPADLAHVIAALAAQGLLATATPTPTPTPTATP